MVSPLNNLLDDINSTIRSAIINLICKTLLYGIYLCLFPIAVHAMVTNGLQSRARKWLLATITFSFTLITAHWIFSVVITFLTVDSLNNVITACFSSQNALACVVRELATATTDLPPPASMAMFADILLVNFIIADGVVVWRAWVLCFDQSKVVLMTPVVMLVINTVIYLITVVVRAIEVITNDEKIFFHLFRITIITQVTHLTLSLIINIYATSVIALKAWKHRKLLMESGIGVRAPRRAFEILALLVESGVIYILIGVTTLASIAILIYFNLHPIASLIFLAGIHLAGIYPIVVVLLVEKNRSLHPTYHSFGAIIDARRDQPLQAEHGAFAPELVFASGDKIDSAMKLPNHDNSNRVTFDSAC